MGMRVVAQKLLEFGETIGKFIADMNSKMSAYDTGKFIMTQQQAVTSALELFLRTLDDDRNWQASVHIGYSGLHQLIVDVTHLSQRLKPYETSTTTSMASKICSKAVNNYFLSVSEEEKKRLLKDGQWFSKCASV
jgi:hypothetical protein